MAFVLEGQADSSQARSAWVATQRAPRPGGTVEVIVSPRDICRRNTVHAALETLGIPVERFGSDDVRPDFGCNEWFLAAGRRSH